MTQPMEITLNPNDRGRSSAHFSSTNAANASAVSNNYGFPSVAQRPLTNSQREVLQFVRDCVSILYYEDEIAIVVMDEILEHEVAVRDVKIVERLKLTATQVLFLEHDVIFSNSVLNHIGITF